MSRHFRLGMSYVPLYVHANIVCFSDESKYCGWSIYLENSNPTGMSFSALVSQGVSHCYRLSSRNYSAIPAPDLCIGHSVTEYPSGLHFTSTRPCLEHPVHIVMHSLPRKLHTISNQNSETKHRNSSEFRYASYWRYKKQRKKQSI